jgi:predicted Zn-dependent protease
VPAMGGATPQGLGEFEIVRELGRGGMGVVYEAVQTSLNRRVALKVLGPGLGLTPQAVVRFRREAAAAAKLHHTNIVPVYATGEEAGTHFYAMELVEGPSLDRVLRQLREGEGRTAESPPPGGQTVAYAEGPGPAAEAAGINSSPLSSGGHYFDSVARMAAGVADALDYAHRQGVIHRDIKPANLLLAPDGRLSLNDFGLARMLEEPGMTMTGEFVGTPAYMSPEQITAGRAPLDHRTDIYSLGATLYELLTLRPPFAGERRDQVIAQIIHKEPKPPRKVNKKVPVDLETICLKALDKDPDRRYLTAGALAEDLRRYVNRFAIAARRAGPVARAVKWVRRRPGVAALLGGLFVALLAAGLFALQAKRSADLLRAEQRQTAVDKAILEAMSGDAESALRAIAEAERLGAEPGQLNMFRGLVELHRGRPKEAIVHLEQAEVQRPDSVAVKALLASAYLGDYQNQRFDEMSIRADGMEPKTPEDVIFLGQAQAGMDPRKGLETLDRVPARARQSPVARLTRAVIQTWYALETGRAEDAEKALKDIDRVELADNPLLMNTHVQALLAAAPAAGPDRPARDAYWKRAAAVATRLARFPNVPTAIQGRCFYYYVTGDDDMLLKVDRQGKSRVANSAFLKYEYDVLYRRKQFDQALASIRASSLDEVTRLLWQAIMYATLGQTDQAERLFLEAHHSTPAGANVAMILGYMYLLGPAARTDPRQLARDVLKQSPNLIPAWRNGWYRDLLKFNAGQMEVAELVAKAGESRSNQCEGYFYIGLHKLYERKRAEAKQWFTKSYNTGLFMFGEYMWSRAFLVHIDDPNWLPWCH